MELGDEVGLLERGGAGLALMTSEGFGGLGMGLPSATPLPTDELCPLSRDPRLSTEHWEDRGISPNPPREPPNSMELEGLTGGGGDPSNNPGSVGLTDGITTIATMITQGMASH